MAYRRTERSEQTREASREAIIAAAQALMSVQGFARTTMQQVVEEAGTSIGNAYFYFRNKEQLFTEVLRRATEQRWAESEAVLAEIDEGPAHVAAIIHNNITGVLEQSRELARALLETHDRIKAVRAYSLSRWKPVLERCCTHLSDVERGYAAASIFGGNMLVVERVIDGSLNGTSTDVADYAVRWNLRALDIPKDEIENALRIARRRPGRAK